MNDIPIINQLPEKYRGWAMIVLLALPYVTRAYHALAQGGGIRGIWNAIWFGTNTPKPGGTPPPVVLLLAAVLALGAVTGCRSLAPEGVYKGDTVLYHADLAIVTSYDVIHAYVTWEYENRSALAVWPEVKASADAMRKGAPNWFRTAKALRAAYAEDPSPVNNAALQKAIGVLRVALTEASAYMAAAATK